MTIKTGDPMTIVNDPALDQQEKINALLIMYRNDLVKVTARRASLKSLVENCESELMSLMDAIDELVIMTANYESERAAQADCAHHWILMNSPPFRGRFCRFCGLRRKAKQRINPNAGHNARTK
jgi:hypothetical protein